MTRTKLYEFSKGWPAAPRAVRLVRRRRLRYQSRFAYHTSARAELQARLAEHRENLKLQPTGRWCSLRLLSRAMRYAEPVFFE
jgi:hypothetical protein